MRIDDLIDQLKEMKSRHGNIEVTMVGTLDQPSKKYEANAFETTVESLHYKEDEFANEKQSKRLLIAWQM